MDKKCINKKKFHELRVNIYKFIKLFLDIVFSILGIIILFPLILIISILIKVDSFGPVFFKQKRTGKNGEEFNLIKFRTMVADNDARDISVVDKYTRIGKCLRKTSLDEIPQLFLIVIGKMSFVGPRPWIPEYFKNMNSTQRKRCSVRPGITGLAQVKGRNNLTIEEKIKYDLEYIKKISLWLDIKILFLTVYTIFTGKGVDAGKKIINDEIEFLKKQNNKKRKD